MPVAEIIAVGTELLLGNTANTDAQDISVRLSELGINVYHHVVVGDNPARLRDALALACTRADILITTGGLGPTYDDLTRETVCEFFDKPLVRHEPTWARIRGFFDEIGREMTPNNERQAMLPEDCVVFQNNWGTAPGFAFEAKGKHVLLLPGPPRECVAMLGACAVPYLEKLSDEVLVSRAVRIFGMGESSVEDKLRPMMERGQNPTIAPYAKEGEVMLRVTARAPTRDEAFALTQPAVDEIRRQLPGRVYGVDVDSLEQVVIQKYTEANKTLACAESCTGGLISKRLTDIPGASRVFKGGVVAYAPEVKTNVLDVPLSVLETDGIVSEAVAQAMAEGVRTLTGADVGIGVTGLAGPGNDGLAVPVGTVCLAVATEAGTESVTHRLGDERQRIRTLSANHGLTLALSALVGPENQY